MSSPRNALSPDINERLKPDKDRHFNRDHHDFQRRRHHRRANKRGRRHRSPRPQEIEAGHRGGAGGRARAGRSSGEHVHRRPPPGSAKNLVLRPTKGPLLNAPKNSTQFIIDDHGGSAPFFDYSPPERTSKKYNTRSRQASTSSSRRVSASSSCYDEAMTSKSPDKTAAVTSSSKEQATTGQATPGNYVVNDDDYTLWAEFSERDFQSVYESAHQEQVADWDRHRLIEEITNLEKRQKELINVLARVDPEMYAQRLESQLQALQEKNRLLRSANAPVGLQNQDLEDPEISSKSKQIRESPDSSTK